MSVSELGVVTVVGAGGRMGAYLMSKMSVCGYDVRGVGVSHTREEVAAALAGANVALLCVHADAIGEVVEHELLEHLDGYTVLADICSVKVQPVATMRALYGGPVVGTHPLYGPNDAAPGMPAHRTALTSGNGTSPEAVDYVERLFRAIGDEVFHTTAEEHDRAMAQFHNLNFLSTVAYFAALDAPEELEPFLLPSFRRRMDAAHISLVDDADMFERLMRQNPMTGDVAKRYAQAFDEACDPEKLARLIEKARVWFK